MKLPSIGTPAPPFSALVVDPNLPEPYPIKLSDFKGERVVLVFYPKDSTPGCTTQACGLRDVWGELNALAKIFGVSIDGVKSHQKFIEKQNLPYPLIVDDQREIVEAYGLWVEKQMYGKTYFGTQRSTVIIGREGQIEAIMESVKPATHAADLMNLLTQLAGS